MGNEINWRSANLTAAKGVKTKGYLVSSLAINKNDPLLAVWA